MKKIGNDFHRILNEEIIKFLNENEAVDPLSADLKEKYAEFLDDPIYAAYAGAPAPGNSASSAATNADSDSEDKSDFDNDPSAGSEGGGDGKDDSNEEESSDGEASSPAAAVTDKSNSTTPPMRKALPEVPYEDDESNLNNDGDDELNVSASVAEPAVAPAKADIEDTSTDDGGAAKLDAPEDTPAPNTTKVDDPPKKEKDDWGGAKQYENKKIDRHSLSFLLEGWEQDGSVKSQTQKSKKDLKLIDIIFDSSRVLSPHAQKYDRR